MANDLTDILRAQLRDVAQEVAKSLADDSTEKKKSRPLAGVKGLVIGAGLTLGAKMAIDAARKGGPGFITDLSERINATLAEVQGLSQEDPEDEPEDEFDEEPELDEEPVAEEEAEEPEPEPEEEPEAEEPEPEAEQPEAEEDAAPAEKKPARRRVKSTGTTKTRRKATASASKR